MAKKDYKALAAGVLEAMGGKDNVAFVMHCTTRLRFQVKDDAKVDREAVEAVPGVLSLVVQNGQYQAVIGPDVPKAYDEVVALGANAGGQVDDDPQAGADDGGKKKSGMDRFFEVVSGIFTPMVSVLIASGMVGALLTILNLCGVPETNPTYYVFNTIYKAGFYFLPFYVAYTSAVKLKCNPFLAMLMAGVMLSPRIVPALQGTESDFTALGVDQLNIFGIPVPSISYAQSVLPIILTVWVMGYIDRFFNRLFPDLVRAFMAPTCTVLVMTPIMLLVIGPLGTWVGTGLGVVVTWLGDNLGFIAVGLIAFFTPLMIATGTHSFAFPVIVATLTTLGYDQILMPSMLAENLAMAGAAMAIALMQKDSAKRGEDVSASLTCILGISEPAMYGVTLPSKYGFFGAMIGAGIGGLFAGIFGFRMYMIASASITGIPAMFGDKGIFNVVIGLITIVLSFAAGFVATWLLAKTGVKLPSIKKNKQAA